MKIQIYISDKFAKFYLPFFLYRNCIYNTVKECKLSEDIQFIYDMKDFDNNSNNIIIMNLYCLNYTKNCDVFSILRKSFAKVILINTEHYDYHNVNNILNLINNEKLKFHILEYNIINYKYFKENYPNLSMFFIPQIYNKALENYYNSCIKTIKNYYEKDIDIFFCGTLGKRRLNILNILKQKYNVHMIQSYSGENENVNIINYMNRSKIMINILNSNENSIFDYYRNSFLLSNKVFLISEKPLHMDLDIEYSLKGYEDVLIISEYDKLIETVDKYLINYDANKMEEIVNKQYEWFKKNDMKDYFIEMFNKI